MTRLSVTTEELAKALWYEASLSGDFGNVIPGRWEDVTGEMREGHMSMAERVLGLLSSKSIPARWVTFWETGVFSEGEGDGDVTW